MVSCLLLVVLLRDYGRRQRSHYFLAGALVGLVIGVQQQKGVVLGPVVALLAVVEAVLERASWRELAARLAVMMSGVVVAIVPVLGTALYLAGIGPVFEALVVHPLLNYAPHNATRWGAVFPLAKDLVANTYPTLLRWSPIVLPATLSISLWGHLHAFPPAESRRWLVLTGVTGASFASALYYPDVVHIAFAAPPAIVSAVALGAWFGRWVSQRLAPGRAVAGDGIRRAVAGLLLGAVALGAIRAWQDTARGYDWQVETKFGRVAVRSVEVARLLGAVVAALQPAGSRGIYVHNFPELYLYLDAANPTPFEIINVANPQEHDQRIIEILEDRKIEFVVTWDDFLAPRAALLRYLEERYAPIALPEYSGRSCILRRNE